MMFSMVIFSDRETSYILGSGLAGGDQALGGPSCSRPELAAAIFVSIVSLVGIWSYRTGLYRTIYGHVLKTGEKGAICCSEMRCLEIRCILDILARANVLPFGEAPRSRYRAMLEHLSLQVRYNIPTNCFYTPWSCLAKYNRLPCFADRIFYAQSLLSVFTEATYLLHAPPYQASSPADPFARCLQQWASAWKARPS
jgi:hypothetical protein